MRNLVQSIWTTQAMQSAGVPLLPGQAIVSIKGGQSVVGGAPLDLVIDKVQSVQSLFYRTVEFLTRSPLSRDISLGASADEHHRTFGPCASASDGGRPIDWRSIRDDIHEEYSRATTPEDHVLLLAIFTAVMDLVERNLTRDAPDKLAEFKNIRAADYRLLLIKESMVGENVCADTLEAVTRREIAAGRLAPDDDFRKTAEQGVAVPHFSRAQLIAMAEKKKRNQSGWRGAVTRLFGGSGRS